MRAFWLSCIAVAVSAVVILVATDPRQQNAAQPVQPPQLPGAQLPAAPSEAAPSEAPANLSFAAPDPTQTPIPATALSLVRRVLFVGNSYTLSNDLPGSVGLIAAANGLEIDIGVEAKKGFSLGEHLERSNALETLHNQDWDTVVIQEMSIIPASGELFASLSEPAIARFARTADDVGTSVMFFQTWGHRDGSTDAGQPGYGPMQREIIENYDSVAAAHSANVAPVGQAWATVIAEYPELNLYVEDGSHPSPAGSYLAALVLTRSLASAPLTAAPPIGVPEEIAADLLAIANATAR